MIQSATNLAFVHIFKAGGTSAIDWMRAQTEVAYHCENPRDFIAHAESNNPERGAYLGHFFLPTALQFLGAKDFTFFTIMRAPRASLMSALWHQVAMERRALDGRDHPQFERNLSLYRHAVRYRRGRMGCQATYLLLDGRLGRELFSRSRREEVIASAMRGLDSMHVVGITERLQDSLRLLAWRLRWPAPRNLSVARASGAGSAVMPPFLDRILSHHLAIDEPLYARATERFEADFRALVDAAGGETAIDDFLDGRSERIS